MEQSLYDQSVALRERLFWGSMAIVFVYGLLLPSNWAELFGPLGWPMQWAVRHVPALRKIVASSSTPEYIAGLLGLAVYVPPLSALCLIRYRFMHPEPEAMYGFSSVRKHEMQWAEKEGKPVAMPLLSTVVAFLMGSLCLYWGYMLPLCEPGESTREWLENGRRPLLGRWSIFNVAGMTGLFSFFSSCFVAHCFIVWDYLAGKKYKNRT